jgi:hypothetical protein
MGNTQGLPIFNDDELAGLSQEERAKLKAEALHEIKTNKDIADLLKTKPEVFANRREVREIVRKVLKPRFNIPRPPSR